MTPKPPADSTQAKSSTTGSNSTARAVLSSTNDGAINSASTPSNARPPASQGVLSAPTPYSANRSKRGGLALPIVHDQTLIPWTDGSTKPIPPRSEGPAKLPLPRRTSAPTTASGDTSNKFTHDEKIFFVHWLRWRLRKGSLPEKETLFEELEAEVRLQPRVFQDWSIPDSADHGLL